MQPFWMSLFYIGIINNMSQYVVHSTVIDKSLFKNEKLILGAVKNFDSLIFVELNKKFDKLMHFLNLYCNVAVHNRFFSLQKLDHNNFKR